MLFKITTTDPHALFKTLEDRYATEFFKFQKDSTYPNKPLRV